MIEFLLMVGKLSLIMVALIIVYYLIGLLVTLVTAWLVFFKLFKRRE